MRRLLGTKRSNDELEGVFVICFEGLQTKFATGWLALAPFKRSSMELESR